MTVLTSTGTTISIFAGPPATHDEPGFAALEWVVIGEVTAPGEYGATSQVVTHEPIETGVTQKHKGFINYGSMAVVVAYDSDDSGQVIASEGVTGATRNTEHSIKVELQDGSIDYSTGKIFSYTKNPGGANSMVTSSIAIEINTETLNIPAP